MKTTQCKVLGMADDAVVSRIKRTKAAKPHEYDKVEAERFNFADARAKRARKLNRRLY
jgi:hypothetical protein